MQLLSDNLVTPNEIFFIRNHLPVPDIDENKYELEITGEGINTVTLSLEVIYVVKFMKLSLPEVDIPYRKSDSNHRRSKAPAKRWQHFNATYPSIAGPAFASSGQTIATFERNRLQHVALVWPGRLATLLQCVATCCELKIKLVCMPRRNIVGRPWPNDYNVMQHPQILQEKCDHFQI